MPSALTKSDSIFSWAILSVLLLIGLLLLHSLYQDYAFIQTILASLVIIFEIVVPIEVLRHYKIAARDFNIYAYNIDTILDVFWPPFGLKKIRPDFWGLARELVSLAKVSLIVLIPYVFAYWAYENLRALSEQNYVVVALVWPSELFYQIIIQIFVVATPEEIFFRGFLQGAMLRKWPCRRLIFRLPLGRALLLTNVVFALCHMFGSFHIERLLTFFPGMVFSYLVYRNKSLVSAVLFHAGCNILGQILYRSIHLLP